ncbi:50S ribosomal protein L14 [Stappia aggregata IAM 12614]|uniref:50S ribosomal protein L14 n=1 Tax=Roseibium aggregatum (strain ATCC 25650 / DSM 13394 / JCM 20685 / NBRC 16684 / NCIMB 2208 / IAM 12614 / B1) TaxID=384765 RepID=A0NWH4_ROSAI|nr:50S ribosomal protein L14 [Stappia aggregata IAM 12614] [Roseibium aggregatum IAM 12614]
MDDFAGLTLVTAGQHNHRVAFFNFRSHQSTSGASEMIFIWFFARSSRGTGPKIRVPIGSLLLLTSTAALRSNRITLPSGRRISFAVRTTTAFITSPFLTRPRGIASLTETTMMSPTWAYLRLEPPSTLMHMTRRAPELSATSRFVCI